MKIVDVSKEIVKWFKLIKQRRETEQILEKKEYAIFSGVVGLTLGVLMGILVMLVQLFMKVDEENILSVILTVMVAALIAYSVWMTFPLLANKSFEIMNKATVFLITLIVVFATFLLGLYGVIIIVLLIVAYWVLRIALAVMAK